MRINYSQCWEDPRILMKALDVTPDDDVISIASGGDNTFVLLLSNPKSITAVDINQAQIFLLELKIRAIQSLEYDDFVGFIGARSSRNRQHLYSHIRHSLSDEARGYWDTQTESICKGIIHSGKFEKYFSIFRRIILPIIHTQKNVRKLLEASSLEQQKTFYDEIWNNQRWQWLFHVFFGKFLLGRLGRDSSLFEYVTLNKVAEELFRRTCRGLTEIPVQDNFFIEYILTGQYSDLEIAHPYLRESNFQFLKDNVGEIRLVCGSFEKYLTNLQAGIVSKFNLSNIFEYMSNDAFEMTFHKIGRISRDHSKLAYWTLFVPRYSLTGLANQMNLCSTLSEKLFAFDRTFFYGSFCLWNVTRGGLDDQTGHEFKKTS